MPETADAVVLWAVIAKPERGREWIHYDTISRTRKEAIDEYGREWYDVDRRAGRVRTARVIVSEAPPVQP